MTTGAASPVPLAEQPMLFESLPTDAIAKAFQAECFRTWADVAAFPIAGFFLYPGVGKEGVHWINNELRRRQMAVRYTNAGSVVVPRFGRGMGKVSERVLPLVPRAGVYFIQCGPFVKIGKAKDIRNRFRQLQQVIPFQLELVGIIEPAEGQPLGELEATLHARFKSARQYGEWFRLENELDLFCLALSKGEVFV